LTRLKQEVLDDFDFLNDLHGYDREHAFRDPQTQTHALHEPVPDEHVHYDEESDIDGEESDDFFVAVLELHVDWRILLSDQRLVGLREIYLVQSLNSDKSRTVEQVTQVGVRSVGFKETVTYFTDVVPISEIGRI